jgi:hypothetical protein
MDDNLQRIRPRSTLSDFGRTATARQAVVDLPVASEPEAAVTEEYSLLPAPDSAYDAAHARASNKPLATLRFITGATVRGLPYANFDSIDWMAPDKAGASPMIVIRFTGLIPRQVVIAGRNLLKLFNQLSDHRIAWLRELPAGRDFRAKDDGATVITSIDISQITQAPV